MNVSARAGVFTTPVGRRVLEAVSGRGLDDLTDVDISKLCAALAISGCAPMPDANAFVSALRAHMPAGDGFASNAEHEFAIMECIRKVARDLANANNSLTTTAKPYTRRRARQLRPPKAPTVVSEFTEAGSEFSRLSRARLR